MDELTDLLRRGAEGDATALAQLVRRTQADVWRFCAHLVDPDAADDLAQEVYLRALRSAGSFRGEASARTWLLAVARRVAADELRRRRRRRRPFSPPASGTAPGPEPDHTGELALRELIADLDVQRREAFVLTQVLGWTYTQAAASLGVPVGTIRSRVARARQQLLDGLAAAARDGRRAASG